MKDTVTVRLTVEQLRTISEALWAYEEIELGDKFGNLYGALTDDNDFTDAPDRQSPDWRPGSDAVREQPDAQSASAIEEEVKRFNEVLDCLEQLFGGKKK
ncbi:MAG: hypothetical protein ACI4SV_00125 [Duodenibacillus sp.]